MILCGPFIDKFNVETGEGDTTGSYVLL